MAEGHQPSAGAGKVVPVRARPFLVYDTRGYGVSDPTILAHLAHLRAQGYFKIDGIHLRGPNGTLGGNCGLV